MLPLIEAMLFIPKLKFMDDDTPVPEPARITRTTSVTPGPGRLEGASVGIESWLPAQVGVEHPRSWLDPTGTHEVD